MDVLSRLRSVVPKQRAPGLRSRPAPNPAPAPAPVPAAAGGAAAADDIDLSALFGILLRQWLFITVVIAIALGAAFAYLLTADPTWRATSRILIDPRDKQIVGNSLVMPQQGTDPVWMETQADLVASEANLATVVRTENLQADPEFSGGSFDGTMLNLAKAVQVERPNATYMLEISITSRDPQKSARLSRALADAFVNSLSEAKSNTARQANALLQRQIESLREEARIADEALQAFRRENGLVAAEGRLIDEATLTQLNKAYIDARLAADSARDRRDSLRALLEAGTTAIDSSLDTLNSAVFGRLKIELALAARRVSDLSQQLGPNHPRMISARADLERTRSLLIGEVRSLAATAAADYELAAAREASVKADLEIATGEINRIGGASVRLRELQNEATARSEVYRAFVARIAETGPQSDVQVSDARVIVPAPVPQWPYTPRRTLVLALALLAGGGIGVSGALYRGRGDLAGSHLAAAPDPVGMDHRDLPVTAIRQVVPSPIAAGRAGGASAVTPQYSSSPLRVLLDLSVDTAAAVPGSRGRPLARSIRSIAASAVEDRTGAPDPAILTELGRLFAALPLAGSGLPIILVQGMGDPAAVAAASYAVARAVSTGVGETLLVDLATDGFPLARALAPDLPPSIAEVLAGKIARPGIASLGGGLSLVRLGAASGVTVDECAGEIARMIVDLSSRHDVCVVHLGDDLSAGLLAAFSSTAGASVLVAPASSTHNQCEEALALEVTRILPGFAGTILVTDRGDRGMAAA